MFTGLIEAMGSVRSIQRDSRGARIELHCPFAAELSLGESVAVNGACLTVVSFSSDSFSAELSNESLARTTLGQLNSGDSVNLERALAVGQRLGGHYVLGHVDAVGRIQKISPLGDSVRFDFSFPPELAPLLIDKGSVAVDGISLTVNEVGQNSFWVALIPESQKRTTLARKRPGDGVNLEGDVLGKYVLRALSLSGRMPDGIGEDLLRRSGFLRED